MKGVADLPKLDRVPPNILVAYIQLLLFPGTAISWPQMAACPVAVEGSELLQLCPCPTLPIQSVPCSMRICYQKPSF